MLQPVSICWFCDIFRRLLDFDIFPEFWSSDTVNVLSFHKAKVLFHFIPMQYSLYLQLNKFCSLKELKQSTMSSSTVWSILYLTPNNFE